MAVYRFRVTFEEEEDIFREIEIKSGQNFKELHSGILASINFDVNEDASFFISDDLWRKGEEIALNSKSTAKKMEKCKIVALIDDPHQKFLYIYSPLKTQWNFQIELVKILQDDPNKEYPLCVKSEGIAPKAIKPTIIATDLLEEEDHDDEQPEDEEAYDNAHSEDEIANLEGEEGEEKIDSIEEITANDDYDED